MKVTVFSSKSYDREFLSAANEEAGQPHELTFIDLSLDADTARLASGSDAVCVFVNDCLNRSALTLLAELGIRFISLRCAGFNNVDMSAAEEIGITVARVPRYSPYAVAEHAVALMLALNRKIHRAYSRVREGNFALEGLMGFTMHGRTIGLIGAGNIGTAVAQIVNGMGCRIVAFDPAEPEELIALNGCYLPFEEVLSQSDIISLHCPLTPATHHMIDCRAIQEMRDGVMLINTSRGAVIDTRAVIDGVKKGKIGSLGLDVYEEEAGLFFRDLSNQLMTDDVFARLLTFPNVVITGHQGFFTTDALREIASATIANLSRLERSAEKAA